MDAALLEFLASCNRDPIRFVHGAFPWGEGTLRDEQPQDWQMELLRDVRDGMPIANVPVKIARSSGHGIGKSAVVAWLILSLYTTQPDCRGVITANTEPQLKTKTWAELGKWFNRFIGREYFKLEATALFSRDRSRERTWRIDAVPWSERNPEAFAGLHNKGNRILLIFDEASAIDDIIWETAEGALSDADTQIIWCVFGNPTKNTGKFKACFDDFGFGRTWRSKKIDSRTVRITNKAQLATYLEIYGEDSDYFRVRVRGEFPSTGDSEFISASAVDEAMAREAVCSRYDPLALGVDVARYGSNASVLFPRKGRDARTISILRYNGLSTVELANRVVDFHNRYRTDGIFVDGGGVGGGVVDNLRRLGRECWDVQFGGRDDVGGFAAGITGERYANKRAAMYGALRAWINSGGALPLDAELKAELIAPSYYLNRAGAIVLEAKEEIVRRLGVSPDNADALALTFAYPIAQSAQAGGDFPHPPLVQSDYNPLSEESIYA